MANQDQPTDPPAIGPIDAVAPLSNRSGASAIPQFLRQSIERQMLGTRLSGLAQGMIDLLDRAVADRIDDARRWAAEPAVVACLNGPTAAAAARLTRLIADRPHYLDLWIADADGFVVAAARNPGAVGTEVAAQPWFRAARAGVPGRIATGEIAAEPRWGGATVLPFAAPIPSADPTAAPAGILVLFFDWGGQSARLLHRARQRGGGLGVRCLLLDRAQRVIAASGPSEEWGETVALPAPPAPNGWFADRHGILFGYARSADQPDCPGLGWSGVVARRPDGDDPIH